MTFETIFSIFTIVLFSFCVMCFILNFFCVQPVYDWMTSGKDGSVLFQICVTFYFFMSAMAMIVVVWLDVSMPDKGITAAGFMTVIYCIIPFIYVGYGILKTIAMCIAFFRDIHYNIKSKRFGDH